MKKEVKIDDTTIYPEDLTSPRQEFSNGGLGIVVTLLVRRGIVFCVFLLGSNPAIFHVLLTQQSSSLKRRRGIIVSSSVNGAVELRAADATQKARRGTSRTNKHSNQPVG